jgi:transaldolase
MKFFIDTADVAEIADLAASGLVDGVTTNPPWSPRPAATSSR